jgi:hypothetical protein
LGFVEPKFHLKETEPGFGWPKESSEMLFEDDPRSAKTRMLSDVNLTSSQATKLHQRIIRNIVKKDFSVHP